MSVIWKNGISLKINFERTNEIKNKINAVLKSRKSIVFSLLQAQSKKVLIQHFKN